MDGAAVAGDPFEVGLAAEVAELSEVAGLAALDELLACALARPAGAPRLFAFRHPVVRHAVYEAAPSGWRLDAHARAAGALERSGAGPVERAHHVEQAARPGDAEAIELLATAASDLQSPAPAVAARFTPPRCGCCPIGTRTASSMSISPQSRRLPAMLGLIAFGLVALALILATSAAAAAPQESAQSANHRSTERLVVRGEDTIKDGPCPDGVCQLELADGVFRGTPVGTGAYNGRAQGRRVVPERRGGVCAPIDGRIVLGAGSADRLVLALSGDSCQDGAGDVTAASFTGIASFLVKHGTGAYAKAKGYGLASFFEDASDREPMTLIGRISR
ncbi:MAG TPA: hypothetical protein VI122_03395 [Thermoleophilaceae bacterium]